MIKILHFADAHIDIAGHGRRDPESGLPFRVLDFLKALDTIIDTAINEKVDMVLFAGDAYKDRTPVPTFQREWGKRIQRLSSAKIPTLLVVGNHDLSPAIGRAHALQEFETLEIPFIRVISKPCLLGPDDLFGLPVQIIGLPWVSRSAFLANIENEHLSRSAITAELEERIHEFIQIQIDKAQPDLPLILTAHASVQGAKFGSERSVMLGSDLILSTGLVTHPKLDYVALGHIHKSQNLNSEHHPPVIYPGSIERVDFGEAQDKKYFVLANVDKGKTEVRFVELPGRPFFDQEVTLEADETDIMGKIIAALPSQEKMEEGMVRLTLYYPRELDSSIDEPELRRITQNAFEFHLLRKPQYLSRVRLPADSSITSMAPLDLLKKYWETLGLNEEGIPELDVLAAQIINQAEYGPDV